MFRYHWPTIGIAFIILILCVLPQKEVPISASINDKFSHILAFFGLAFIATRGVYRQFMRLPGFKVRLLVGILIWLYGGLIELIQAWFVPTRFGDWYDFIADGTGVFLGLLLFSLVLKTPAKRWI